MFARFARFAKVTGIALRSPKRLAGVALTLAASAGDLQAETWSAPVDGSGALQLDTDSVSAAGADRFAAVWRLESPSGRSFVLKRGIVDCRGESLRILSETYVDADTGPGAYGTAVVDYAAGSRTWQGRERRLTDAERAAGEDFPAPASPAARLVEAVCASRSAAWPGRPTALDRRLCQAERACGFGSGQTGRLRAVWLARADDCARSPTACAAEPLTAALASLGADLARAAAGLDCTYLPEALAQVIDADAQRAAGARFQACVERSVGELDDGVSEADVIASGVYGACRGELPAAVAQGRSFADGLMPGLTAAVLKHRSAGRVNLPTKPKRSQAG